MADLLDTACGEHLEAIKADIIALALEEIGSNVHIRKMAWLLPDDVKPICLICNIPERILREGMIGQNDFRFRALVAFIRGADARSLDSNHGTNLSWRSICFNRYHRSTALRAYGVTGMMGSEVEPGIPQDAQALMKDYDAQHFVIQTRCRLTP